MNTCSVWYNAHYIYFDNLLTRITAIMAKVWRVGWRVHYGMGIFRSVPVQCKMVMALPGKRLFGEHTLAGAERGKFSILKISANCPVLSGSVDPRKIRQRRNMIIRNLQISFLALHSMWDKFQWNFTQLELKPGTVEKSESIIGPPAGIEPTLLRCRCKLLSLSLIYRHSWEE